MPSVFLIARNSVFVEVILDETASLGRSLAASLADNLEKMFDWIRRPETSLRALIGDIGELLSPRFTNKKLIHRSLPARRLMCANVLRIWDHNLSG